MKINFRQGVVSYQTGGFLQVNGGNVDILASNRSVTVTIAHRDTNYTHSEDNYVASAWVGPFTLPNYYLYWDFDPLTFERTFGHTHLDPVAQSVEPGSGDSPILAVVPGVASPAAHGSFTVAGHYALPTGKRIWVQESTGNDGMYTVKSYTYDVANAETTIVVNEAVSSTVADGELTLDIDRNLQPLFQPGRHWYNTATNIHYVLNDDREWVEVIRVFAAQLVNGNTFVSLSINATSGDFSGTQIGDTTQVSSGRVLFTEQVGDPMRRDDGTFFTTEDQFFTNQSRVDALRLESNVSRAQSVAGGTTAAFGIVAWTGDGQIRPATYEDVGTTVVGVLTEPLNYLQVGAVITQGTVTNPAWTWTTGAGAVPVGSSLWVDNGQLTATDPHLADPVGYPNKQVPVARVLSIDTIIFEQGLGGVGPQGPTGTVTDLPVATAGQLGIVSLSQAPADPENPIVVGINNSVIQGAPYAPETHFHAASNVTFTPIANVTSSNVQGAIGELLSRKGGAMTGSLTLNGAPTVPLGAATKAYVDSIAEGLDAKEACVVGTTTNVGGTYTPTAGTGGTGAFANALISSLDGVYGTDYQLAIDARILVKDESVGVNADYRNGIYVVTALGAGSPPTLFDMERAPDFDSNDEIRAGNYTVLRSGATQAGQGWVLTDIHPTDDIELNNHPITWTLVSAAASYIGDGVTINVDGGNIISVIPASSGGTVDAQLWNSQSITVGGSPLNGQPLIYNLGTWQNAAFSLPLDAGTNEYILQSDGVGNTSWVAVPITGLQNVVEDTSPQLGGDLDVNGYGIVTPSLTLGSPIEPSVAGNINITSGSHSYTGHDAGDVNITSGNVDGGAAGAINITSGNNTNAVGGTAGNITLQVGNSSFTTPGVLGLYGGDATTTGGAVSIKGGLATSPGGQHGGVTLQTEDNATGSSGIIRIQTGDSSDATGIDIQLQPGAGATTDGAVVIEAPGGVGDAIVRLESASGAYHTELGSATLTANTTFTLPASDGTTGQVLTRDSGTGTEWTTATTAIGTDLVFTSTPSYDWITSSKDEFALRSGTNTGFSINTSQGVPDSGYDFAGLGGTYAPITTDVYSKAPDNVSVTGGIVDHDNGAYLWWMENAASDPRTIHQRTLGTAYQVTTAGSAVDKTFNVGSHGTTIGGGYIIRFNDTGTKMFVAYLATGFTGYGLAEYTVGTPYDISTASLSVAATDIGQAGDTTKYTPYLSYDGEHLYVGAVNGGNRVVHEYSLGTAWDISTLSFVGSLNVNANTLSTGFGMQVVISHDGTKLIVGQTDSSGITFHWNIFNLATPYLLSSATWDSQADQPGEFGDQAAPRQWMVDPTGTIAYTFGDDNVYQWDIAAGDGGVGATYSALFYDGGSPPSMTTTASGIDVNGNIVTDSGVDKLTTASGAVDVSAATAPTAGQVLTATGATTATWQTPLPKYERIVVSGSPPNPVINTTVPTVSASGSPVLTASIQVFRNGLLQEEDIDGASPIEGDFIVSGPNQITFTDASLFDGGTIIIYSFAT